MDKRFLILFLLLVLLVPLSRAQITIGQQAGLDYSNPKDYIIGGITVSGVRYLDANVLIMLSGLTVGEKVKIPSDKITTAGQGFQNSSSAELKSQTPMIYAIKSGW